MRNEQGYTFAELLAVVAIVGLMVALGLHVVNTTLPVWRVESAGMEIASALRAARAKAVLDRTTIAVPFDTARGLYVLVPGTTSAGKVIVESGIRLAELPGGVRFARPDGTKTVTFSPPGAPSDKTALFAANGLLESTVRPASVYIGDPSRAIYKRVRVNLVGTVAVERWTGTTWKK